ncbi:unnamed protein product [Lampetra planeri]
MGTRPVRATRPPLADSQRGDPREGSVTPPADVDGMAAKGEIRAPEGYDRRGDGAHEIDLASHRGTVSVGRCAGGGFHSAADRNSADELDDDDDDDSCGRDL